MFQIIICSNNSPFLFLLKPQNTRSCISCLYLLISKSKMASILLPRVMTLTLNVWLILVQLLNVVSYVMVVIGVDGHLDLKIGMWHGLLKYAQHLSSRPFFRWFLIPNLVSHPPTISWPPEIWTTFALLSFLQGQTSEYLDF